MKSLLLAVLFLPLPVMSAPKFVIQYRDQFGNYRNYQTQHGRTSAYRTAETKARQTGKVYRIVDGDGYFCLLYTSPSPRDKRQSRMPSSA